MKHLIFVYGSLKRGQRLHHLLTVAEGANRFISEMETPTEYTLYDLGWYPGMKKQGSTRVKGECWEVDQDTFDYLEGMERAAGYIMHMLYKAPLGEVWTWLYTGATNPKQECGNNWDYGQKVVKQEVKALSPPPSSPETETVACHPVVSPELPQPARISQAPTCAPRVPRGFSEKNRMRNEISSLLLNLPLSELYAHAELLKQAVKRSACHAPPSPEQKNLETSHPVEQAAPTQK